MKFTGFGRGVADKIASWHLPDRVLYALRRNMTPLVDAHPCDLDFDDGGMFYAIGFEDDDAPGDRYLITLRICREDESFFASDISGFGMNAQGQVGWDSEA